MTGVAHSFTQLLELALRDGWWVPVETYLASYPGETREAIYSRRSKGLWQDGVHSKFVKGAGLWINLMAVNSWVAKSALRQASPSDAIAKGAGSGSA